MTRPVFARGTGTSPMGPAGRDGTDGIDGLNGLPGVNAVANDTATAAYVANPTSATAAALSASYVPSIVAVGTGIDPTGTSDSKAGFMARFLAAEGSQLVIPPGDYRLDSPIEGDELPTDISVTILPGVRFWAHDPMLYMLSLGTDAGRWADCFFDGGHALFDCVGKANTGVRIKSHLNSDIGRFKVRDSLTHAVHFGSSANNNSNELRYADIKVDRNPASTPPGGGAAGIYLENVYDSHGNKCIVVGSQISFKTKGDANKQVQCHGWGYGGKLPDTIFDNDGFNNEYVACKADSPAGIGFRMRGLGWRITGGEVFNGPDGVAGAVGVQCDQGFPSASIVGLAFNGTSGAPLAADLIGAMPGPYLQALCSQWFNVTTRNILPPAQPQVQKATAVAPGASTYKRFYIGNKPMPTFNTGSVSTFELSARDTATGTRATAVAKVLVSREGGACAASLRSVRNDEYATLFGNGIGTSTYGVGLDVDTDGTWVGVYVKNNHATNNVELELRLV